MKWAAIINKYNREGNFAIIYAACAFKTKREAIDMVRNNWGGMAIYDIQKLPDEFVDLGNSDMSYAIRKTSELPKYIENQRRNYMHLYGAEVEVI